MFVCGHCGGNVIGYGNSSHQWKKYICGVNRTRGPVACNNKWLIEQKWLENIIVAEIEKRKAARAQRKSPVFSRAFRN